MKLSYRRTFFIGLAFLSICAFWQLYEGIVPLILKKTFGIGDTVSGVIMALDNVLALFMLPLFGTLSDKTASPLGKRMPFIIGGTALAVVSMAFMPVGDNAGSLTLFIAALMITLIAMSTYRSPAVALMPDVTPKPLRSKANAVINLMGAVGGAVTLGLIAVMVPDIEKPNYFPVFSIIAILMVVAVVVLFLTVKENKLVAEMQALNGHKSQQETAEENTGRMAPEVRKSLFFILISIFFWFMAYNAVTTAFSKYAQELRAEALRRIFLLPPLLL
jgi:Na+/melibiose symporter-like transporter